MHYTFFKVTDNVLNKSNLFVQWYQLKQINVKLPRHHFKVQVILGMRIARGALDLARRGGAGGWSIPDPVASGRGSWE